MTLLRVHEGTGGGLFGRNVSRVPSGGLIPQTGLGYTPAGLVPVRRGVHGLVQGGTRNNRLNQYIFSFARTGTSAFPPNAPARY